MVLIIPYHEVSTVAFFSRLFSTMKLLTTQIMLDIDPQDIERIQGILRCLANGCVLCHE